MDYNKKYLKYKAKYIKLKNKIKNQDNKLVMTGGKSNDKAIYLFKADWCPHCNQFKPIWSKLQDEMKNKVNFITYDSAKNANEIKQYNIEGFPTLIFKDGNKAIEYVGPRDEDSVRNFINQYN
jgi:thiol-disulfide isomerase/thioredoxin